MSPEEPDKRKRSDADEGTNQPADGGRGSRNQEVPPEQSQDELQSFLDEEMAGLDKPEREAPEQEEVLAPVGPPDGRSDTEGYNSGKGGAPADRDDTSDSAGQSTPELDLPLTTEHEDAPLDDQQLDTPIAESDGKEAVGEPGHAEAISRTGREERIAHSPEQDEGITEFEPAENDTVEVEAPHQMPSDAAGDTADADKDTFSEEPPAQEEPAQSGPETVEDSGGEDADLGRGAQ